MNIDNVGARISVLILETQEHDKEVDRVLLDSARQDYADALDDQVAALRAQADAAFQGALVEGSLVAVSGGLEAWGATCDKPDEAWQTRAAPVVAGLAQPLGGLAGHDYGGADAKRAEGELQQARWEIDDLKDNRQAAEQAQDQALDWSASLTESDAATTRAVLANLV
ncbi:MAG TPA: hypothetical protein VJN18_22590 [Polyangiaceae bacterium]|nr:hypothetical protein [Polyangiaceae bacterium]